MRKIGDVFYHAPGKSFWMVVGAPKYHEFFGSKGPEVYPVVKCNKNGKTFARTNGFAVEFVNNLLTASEVGTDVSYFVGNFAKTPARTDGKAIGVKKRRIKYLKSEMAKMTEELARLEAEIKQ